MPFWAFAVLAVGATVLMTGLQEEAYTSQTEQLGTAVDQAEKDLGTYDESSAKAKPAMKRVFDLNKAMRQQAADNQSQLDSLLQAENELDVGYQSSDSTKNDY
ncbi:MAG: hypothetical protein IPP40_10200 [bacterium]|nr:hypothetical protein [bacterium]